MTKPSELHAVVLAGGSGTRFWPLSREMSPKQLLTIFGGVSLMVSAILRIEKLCGPEGIHIVTGERLFDEIRNHLTSEDRLSGTPIDYIIEPGARNTAPAIALAAAVVARKDPDALIIVLPSDHLLEDGETWRHTVRAAMRAAEEGYLVTIGLVPSEPETGYGYIKANMPLGLPGEAEDVHSVDRFVEKPDRGTAERFLREGGYLWNSGMLVARASTVLDEMRAAGAASPTPDAAAATEIVRVAEALAAADPAEWLTGELGDSYNALPAVPFDKAVLEVSNCVAVVPTSLAWSDVGSLQSLTELAKPDERGNVLVGRVTDVESSGIIGYSQDRLVATLGLKDVLVVDTSDATLVVAKDRTQDVRLVVEALRAIGAPEVVSTNSSLRPWGSWTLLMKGDGFQIKSIDVKAGHRLSLQSHARRSEHWVVVEGSARVERDGEVIELANGESVYLPLGAVHRLENPGPGPLKVVEVAVGEYLGEDDIMRFEDDWGRLKETT
ncbi:MAG: mannose-1-phosphate guanylyltransferase/mannose-6-phosphate isomerase [Coriobacteriia bacterium]|nr:mannose-1-phosphate guanylyltransferase/mannose-6-phosphate isomerase [Coriobacteriia bacterium]